MVQIQYAYPEDTQHHIGGYYLGQQLAGSWGRVVALVVDKDGDDADLVDVITSNTYPSAARTSATHGTHVIMLDGNDASDFPGNEFNVLAAMHDEIALYNDCFGISDYIAV